MCRNNCLLLSFLSSFLSFFLLFPGAHTLVSISSTPTLHELDKLTVGHVASQLEEVAPHLVVESCGVCKLGAGHLQEASREALSRCLKGESDTDVAEKTRCSILEAQEASGNIQLAEQRMPSDESSGAPVIGLAFAPGMCVNEQNVWTLFVMSTHCTALNT